MQFEHLTDLYSKVAKRTKDINTSLEDEITNLKNSITNLYDDTIQQTKEEFEDIFLSLLEELVKYKQCKIPQNKFSSQIKKLKREIEVLEKLTFIETDLILNLPKQPAYILAMLECYFEKTKAKAIYEEIHYYVYCGFETKTPKPNKQAITLKEFEEQREAINKSLPDIFNVAERWKMHCTNNKGKSLKELIETFK